MFDIGFWEIIIIGVVALLVVGPDKFPGLIKNIGFWVGRFRQVAGTVKSELQTEINKAEQLQKLLEEQEEIAKRHDVLQSGSGQSVSVKGKAPEPETVPELKKEAKPDDTTATEQVKSAEVERKPE